MDPHIVRRADALQRGASDWQLQFLCRNGSWHRLRRGAYMSTDRFADLGVRERHRARATATLRAASEEAVLSHQSAAIVHDIDLWRTPLAAVHLTRNRQSGGHRTPVRHLHCTSLHPQESTTVDGLRVTSAARTVVDLARTLPFEQAVVAGDHALHSGLCSSGDLAATDPRTARRRVAGVLRLLDGRSESVGESRSRVLMIREQLPVPDCQPNLYADDGKLLGRVDFLFAEHGVVGEFDGRAKYGRLAPDGHVPEEVVWAEKLREDAIRSAGWEVVRWVWDELDTPAVVVGRLLAAFDRSRARPTGRVERTPCP
ncbi:hypothetical protein [Rhodococcus sp. SGAir0479]|uniref:hypothetical protein n=1 Tax=Rhodococcus sp. SGAir0479 TaxID=2567884 RepID=UPI0010CCCB92|nr:hypothetical protein [Rhodococcus sp. SGAir0479]QCQ92544.1 hypothetical protein E7742_15835 [Rhodococcus sp. SGAir0479]